MELTSNFLKCTYEKTFKNLGGTFTGVYFVGNVLSHKMDNAM